MFLIIFCTCSLHCECFQWHHGACSCISTEVYAVMDSSDDDAIEPGDDEPSSQNLPFLGVCGLLPITCLGCHEGCSQKMQLRHGRTWRMLARILTEQSWGRTGMMFRCF